MQRRLTLCAVGGTAVEAYTKAGEIQTAANTLHTRGGVALSMRPEGLLPTYTLSLALGSPFEQVGNVGVAAA